MISTSLLRFLLITTIFYVMLGLFTFHFFASLFIFTLIFSIGCVCFVSYRQEQEEDSHLKEEKEEDSHLKKKHGWFNEVPQIGGAETLSEEILGIVLLLLFLGAIPAMSQVKIELQKSINKFYIFLILLLLALTGLGLGYFLELRISIFLL